MKKYKYEEMIMLNKEDLIEELVNCYEEYDEVVSERDELADNNECLIDTNNDLQNDIDELSAQIEYNASLIEPDLLKEKLELYGFKTEALWNFLSDFERLYQYK